jgi:lysophospholipase L1-like esterase
MDYGQTFDVGGNVRPMKSNLSRARILCLVLGVFPCSVVGCSSDDATGAPGTTRGSSGSTAGAGGSSTSSAGGASGSGVTGTAGSGGGASSGGAGGTGTGGTQGGGAGTGGTNAGGRGGTAGTGGSTVNDAGPPPPTDAGGDAVIVGDGGAYNPCPPKGMPCVILPVGDSVTAGEGSSDGGSYRAPLFHLANTHSQSITFVGGGGASGPATVDGITFPRANSGYSGFNIDNAGGRSGISQFFPAQITTDKPDIILLMIGTNDTTTDESDPPTRLAALLDKMLNADPTLLLVVAQVIPQRSTNAKLTAFNAAIPGLVKTRADAGQHIVTVDMYGAFVANPSYATAYLADGLHPNDAGYKVMADTWYAAIGSLLR